MPKPKITAEQWNANVPVGTAVRYFSIAGEGEGKATKTRSAAWALGHGAVVVSVEGQSGGVSIEHLIVLT